MGDRIVTLEKMVLDFYSDRDLLDITEYFNPSVFFINGDLDEKDIDRVEGLTKVNVLDCSVGFEFLELDDFDLVSVGDIDSMEEVYSREFSSRLCILSSFIEQKTDMQSFETEIYNISKYRDIVEGLDCEKIHLTSTLEAGNKFSRNGVDIYGVNTIERIEGVRIPCIELDSSISFEPLPINRVGIQAVPEVGSEAKRKLRKHGFSSREDLLNVNPRSLLDINGVGPHYACLYIAGAKAIEKNKIVKFDEDPLEGKRRIYIDIETDSLNPDIIWQIGLYDEGNNSYRYFIENEDPTDKSGIVNDFLKWIDGIRGDVCFVSWHGSQFDYIHLNDFIDRFGDEKYIESWKETEKIDLLHEVAKSCVALPTRSFSLGDVSSRLGYEKNIKGLSGSKAGEVYSSWMRGSGREPDWEKWILYCKDDVMAMKYIYDKISNTEKHLDKREIKKKYRKT